MVLMNLNTRKGIVNLFADYILNKIGSNSETIIQVTDCGSFFVVNGETEMSIDLNLSEITRSFESEFNNLLSDRKINTIDLIKTNVKPTKNQNMWFTFFFDEKIFYIKKFINEESEIDPLQISSEFPFGYGIPIDRDKLYYSEYVCSQLFDLINTNTLKFKFSSELIDEFPNIEILGEGRYSMDQVKSMVLDVFDFDLIKFNKKIESYDVLRDLTHPSEHKPWSENNKKNDMWIF